MQARVCTAAVLNENARTIFITSCDDLCERIMNSDASIAIQNGETTKLLQRDVAEQSGQAGAASLRSIIGY